MQTSDLEPYVVLMRRATNEEMPPEAIEREAIRIAEEQGINEMRSVLLCATAYLQVAEEQGVGLETRQQWAAAYLDTFKGVMRRNGVG